MLHLIGLGLYGKDDITMKGLQIIKKCTKVYLESYTSILGIEKEELEEFYGCELILADRELVEQSSDTMLADASEGDVAFLVVGDPLGATTHSDLILRAVEKRIPYRVTHNASIINAVGCTGLQLYCFGEVVSIVFWTENWRPESFYDKIDENMKRGLHTLCLLDIKVKEQSVENMMRGRKVYEPPRYMTINQATEQLLEVIANRRQLGKDISVSENTLCVGVARVAADTQQLVAAPLHQLTSVDFGPPLHSLIIVGKVHPLEKEMLQLIALNQSAIDLYADTT